MINYAERVPPISLSQFLKRSTTYESMPAPISPALRRAACWGIALCAVSLCIYLVLPIEAIPRDTGAFFMLGEQFYTIISWIESRVASLVILSIVGNIVGIMTLIGSHGLKQAKAGGHMLALLVVIIGILCILPAMAAITIAAVNLIAYLVIVILALALAILGLIFLPGILLGGASR